MPEQSLILSPLMIIIYLDIIVNMFSFELPYSFGISGFFYWHADFINRFFFGFPLHNVHSINVVAVQTVPDVFPAQSSHGPVVPLADHLFSHVIFPFLPIHLRIGRDVLVQDDDREIQAAVHFESTITLGPARWFDLSLNWSSYLDYSICLVTVV